TRWIRSYRPSTHVSTPQPTFSTPPPCYPAARDAATNSPTETEARRCVPPAAVVAGLRPVAEDLRRPALAQPVHEDRADTGFALRILARPVHVPEPQRHVAPARTAGCPP